MDFSHLKPLPGLDFSQLTVPRAIDLNYFSYYGLDFLVPHYFGAIDIPNQAGEQKSFSVACHLFLPDNAQGSVFIVHGLFDHTGLYNHLIKAALDNNLAVCAFDLPGHGLSSGKRGSIQSFSQYTQVFETVLTQAQALMPKPWHVVAQSTGATVVMDYLQQTSAPQVFQTRAFLAPLVRPHLWPLYRHQFNLLKRLVTKKKRTFRKNSTNASFLKFLHYRDALQPRWLYVSWVDAMQKQLAKFMLASPMENLEIVMLQGTIDKTVDGAFNTQVIEEKFIASKTIYLQGAEHHLVNERAEVINSWRDALHVLWCDGFDAVEA